MKVLILNDLHLGVRRVKGTTPESRLAMENWMFNTLEGLLEELEYDAVVVAGDLYDKRTVPEHVILRTIKTFNQHTSSGGAVIMLGNHDEEGRASVNDNTISSAEMTEELLTNSMLVKGAPMRFDEKIYLIPHMFNQEEFDKAVEDCPENCFMICHCNVDSPFAVGDSSLNLSKEQIKTLKEKNVIVIAGHEHIQRDLDNVWIPGNQIPTSISDLTNCEEKVCYIIDTDTLGVEVFTVFNARSYSPDGSRRVMEGLLKEYDYKTLLSGGIANFPFIKISGTCATEEWPDVLRAYSKLRKESEAFVISNKVEVPAYTVGSISEKEVTDFNVVDLLISAIDEEFREEVKDVIKIN